MKKFFAVLLFTSSAAFAQTQINGNQIKDGAITNAKIASNAAIGWAKINWGSFDLTQISAAHTFSVTSPLTYGSNVIGLGIVPITLGGTGAATSSAALTALGGVPTARVVNTTAPLAGGGALSGDLTLTIASFSGTAAGAVPANPASNKTELYFRGDGAWTTFPTVVTTARTINTTVPLTGGGALSSDLTLAVTDFVASGTNHAAGLVPDPSVTPGTTKVLKESGGWYNIINADLPANLETSTLYSSDSVLTNGTLNRVLSNKLDTVIHKFTWANTDVVALGGVLNGTITVATLPAKTLVKRAWIVITGQGAGATTFTVSLGRVGTGYIDYVVASDAKAAANTVYGQAIAEIGTGLEDLIGDLPSYTATTDIKVRFVTTIENLSAVTGSTGAIYLETTLLP